MTTHQHHTALITGANSGVGLEAAAQLAEAGYGRVILAARSTEKAEAARAALVERTGKDPFSSLVIDTAEVEPSQAAAKALDERGEVIDVLILNAGASSSEPRMNADGVEMTWASTLIGHHVLTMELLQRGRLGPKARIIIAGSEGARGDLPGMRVHDVAAIAQERFEGDQAAAIVALARQEVQDRFVNMDEYVTAKRIVAWWAGALASRLPEGMTVNAVSPGSAPVSNFGRGASFAMRIMITFMKVVGPLMGMAGGLEPAARRYVDAAEFGDEENGRFYATAHPKKLVGPMGVQSSFDIFRDRASQEAALAAVVELTGVPVPRIDARPLHAAVG